MKYTLFIFRRDLRLEDNNGINYALENYENIIPIFIFTPEQVVNNKFKSDNAIQFMVESLKNLNENLEKHKSKLRIFFGSNEDVLNNIIKNNEIENIVFNIDYTPYAQTRDEKIKKICEKNNINCNMLEDYLLKPIGSFNKDDGNPYTVYTPFKNNSLKHKIDKPIDNTKKNKYMKKFVNSSIKLKYNKDGNIEKELNNLDFLDYVINENILVHGGRTNGLVVLNNALKLKDYDKNRNTLSYSTSLLSAYIKFGCLSIREIYHEILKKFGLNSTLLSQLIWREFYFYISYYFPNVLKGENYNSKYDNIKWNEDENYYKKWCAGETGFPIVDAGMRELNSTGYMHNRSRLITSNFLNRMLGMNWTRGELYFAQKLTDYDPSVNNGNWQWVSSVGVDPKPYFQRLFNPMLQSEKFDKNCEYIKKWIPSLKDIPNGELHNWGLHYNKYDLKELNYVKPIVDYKEAREKSVAMYRKVL